MVSEEKSAIILISFPLEHFPSLGFFQDLFFIFGYLQFEYDMPKCSYVLSFQHLCCLMFLELPGSVIWLSVINFGKFLGIITSNISSALFFFPPVFQLCMCCPFWVSHHSWMFCSVCCCYILLFAFHFRKFLLSYLQSCWFFSLSLSNLLTDPSNICCNIFYFYRFLLILSWFPSLCLYYQTFLECCLLLPLDLLTH